MPRQCGTTVVAFPFSSQGRHPELSSFRGSIPSLHVPLSTLRHSLRHTFVTDMMEATGNDVALVMSYSGHKLIESFGIYLHPTQQGRILANQRMNNVGDFFGTFSGIEGTQGIEGTSSSPVKALKRKQVVV